MRFLKKLEPFFICFIISVGIISLRFVADYPEPIVKIIHNITELAEGTMNAFGLLAFVELFKNIPIPLLILFLSSIQILIGLLFLSVFKASMEQGTMALIREFPKVLKNGMVLYFMAFFIFMVYFYSVIGVPVSFGIFLLAHLFSMIGSVPVAIGIGYAASEKIGVYGHTYLYFLFGRFLMLLCESVIGVGGAFLFFIFPVVSIGVVSMMFLNRYLFHKSYVVQFRTKAYEESFDRKKIRDIIRKGIDSDSKDGGE